VGGWGGTRPATQGKRENSVGQKGKGKRPRHHLSSNSTWQPDRAHARTKRNDFPVGVTPQPTMLLIYDSVTHYASSNRMICCTYPCVHYSFKLAAIIACCALLGGLAPCSALLGGLTPCIAACSPLDLDGARTIRNRRWCSCLHICSR